MKKIIAITTLVAATSASAFFGNSNGMSNWGPFDGGSNKSNATTDGKFAGVATADAKTNAAVDSRDTK
ncbi:hypothetical protein [uncultured Gammaproteobacteria bacterium]|nr:hypothetical protein [uncultured Gammaproteobacteria bacterium]